MSNAAKFEVPDGADDGKTYVYSSGSDSHVLTSLAALYQPLDSDLTAVAALTTTSFGRGLLELANAAALRTTAGLVIGTDVQAYSAVLAATTASFTTADETKLDGIEAAADVTDETNVVAALSGATLTDLGTPASGDKILLLDASDSDNLKVAQFSTFGGGGGGIESVKYDVTGSGYWCYSPYLATPQTSAWPIINRAYVSPHFFSESVDITALAVNVASAGTAGNVIRLGIYSAGANGLPATVLAQGTVAGDSPGYKTLTLGAAVTLSGLFWIAAGPQGSTSPGNTWLSSNVKGLTPQFDDSGSSFSGSSVLNWAAYFSSSGSFTDSPTLTQESAARLPYVPVRIT